MKKAASFIRHLHGLVCHEKNRSLNEIYGENDTVPSQSWSCLYLVTESLTTLWFMFIHGFISTTNVLVHLENTDINNSNQNASNLAFQSARGMG